MEFRNLTLGEFDSLIQKMKSKYKKGNMVIETLASLSPNLNVILNTDVGKQILAEDIGRMDELMVKIYREEINPQDLAEFRYLRDKRIPYLISKVSSFVKNVDEVRDSNHKS